VDARTRVRQFLARGTADRPPFLVMATEYTARLAQCTPAELLADPGLFVRSFTESIAVLGLEALLIEVPAARLTQIPPACLTEVPPARPTEVPPARPTEVPPASALPVAAVGDPEAGGIAVLREDLHRLRATLRDQIAIVALLPGPLTLAASLGVPATPDALDDLVAALISLQDYLAPAEPDALALLERVAVADPDVPALADATAAFWNVARYYSLPSLLIAVQGPPQLATVGSTAVAAWSGVTAADLLAAGATAAGQPPPPAPGAPGQPRSSQAWAPSQPPPPAPAPLPPGGFYLTPGEIPADWPVDAVRSLVRQLSQS
jgi:hypothetical protein